MSRSEHILSGIGAGTLANIAQQIGIKPAQADPRGGPGTLVSSALGGGILGRLFGK